MKHLTEDILIQYQFDLLEDAPRQEAAAHLAACEECRRALTALQRKFAVLDVLDAEEQLPQELVAKTLRQRNAGFQPALGGLTGRTAWWRWGGLLSAAAAVVIVGFVWLHQPKEAARETLPQVALLESVKDKRPAGKAESYTASRLTAAKPSAPAVADALMSEDEIASVRVVDADAIPDKPPFAPASAIELVVLPNPDAMQVTIYNSADLTLVRDTRKLVLKPGWNWLQFMWAGTKIDPTSLNLRPLEHADKVSIEQLVYPARLRELGRWLVRSEVEGAVPFEITYFTSGLSWQAMYEGTLTTDETAMDLKGYVRVANNSGQDYVNAQTRLLLGQVRLLDRIKMLADRRYPYGPDVLDGKSDYDFREEKTKLYSDRYSLSFGVNVFFDLSDSAKPKGIEKEGLSEYFLYTIEGTEDLRDAWGKRLQSMDVSGIPVKSLYKYDEERYQFRTVRFLSFGNDTEHELGETPLPEGWVRLFRQVNDERNLSFVGKSAFKYIPVNEDVELQLWNAQELVKVEPKRMDTRTANYTFDKDNNVNGWDEIETWQIKLTNTRDISADIEITRDFGTDYWELEWNAGIPARAGETETASEAAAPISSPPAKGEYPEGGRGYDSVDYKKHDKRRARFTATLAPRSEQTFSYVVTKYQGQRSEYYVEKQKEQ